MKTDNYTSTNTIYAHHMPLILNNIRMAIFLINSNVHVIL